MYPPVSRSRTQGFAAAVRVCIPSLIALMVATGCDSAPFTPKGSCPTAVGLTFYTQSPTGLGPNQINCAEFEQHAARAKQLLVSEFVNGAQWPSISPTPVYVLAQPGRFYFEDGYYWGVTSWHGWILVERSDESLVHELLHRHELVNLHVSGDESSKHKSWVEHGYYRVAGVFGDWVRGDAKDD